MRPKGKSIIGALVLGTALLAGLIILWNASPWRQIAGHVRASTRKVDPDFARLLRQDANEIPGAKINVRQFGPGRNRAPLPFPGPAGGPAFVRSRAKSPDDPECSTLHTEPALTLTTDPAGERKLTAARDLIQHEAWDEAARILQSLLDGPDSFMLVKEAAKQGTASGPRTTLHAEISQLLDTLPSPGRMFYEWNFGGRARALLTRAKELSDSQLLAEASRRYAHTVAGAEAKRLLGIHHLDRGRFTMAALTFERLLSLPDRDKLSPEVLFTAALAFDRAGQKSRADQLWKQLTVRAPDGLPVNRRAIKLSDLESWLAAERRRHGEAGASREWLLFNGDAKRSAWVDDGKILPQIKWRLDTANEFTTHTWIRDASRRLETQGEPVLPAFLPIAVDGKLVYRSHRGVHAVDAQTGQLLWASDWLGGLDTLGQELSYFPYLESWVNAYLQHDPSFLLANSVVGTLSTDGERVYAVEDLALPPYQNTYYHRGRPVAVVKDVFTPGLAKAAHHSRLVALNLNSGNVAWERGGPAINKENDALYPGFFLGPPLPVDGRLYGLMEKEQELRLICLDAVTGKLVWLLPLGLAPTRLAETPSRRIQAVHLAYSEGVLVCPTGAGFVFGIDAVARSFLWAYCYREPTPWTEDDFPGGRGGRGRAMPAAMGPPLPRPTWLSSAPILADGKVVITTPDGPSIHCLNLADGALLWKSKQAPKDLFVAGVHHGKVLVTGEHSCRALDLDGGKPLWETATDHPTGVGVFGNSLYYLPGLNKDKQPVLDSIGLNDGRVHVQIAHGPIAALGNLVIYADAVVSQTIEGITAFPWQDSSGR
jgi:outer membrane protein assembly factor BamB